MNSAPTQTAAGEGFSGTWQIPLLLVALALFVAALVQLRPAAPEPTIDEQIARIQSYLAAQLPEPAIEDATRLLEDEALAAEQRGRVHLVLASALVNTESTRARHDRNDLLLILAHFQQAIELDAPLTVADLVAHGQLYEWLGKLRRAAAQYARAAELGGAGSAAVAKRALELNEHLGLVSPAERLTEVERILAGAGKEEAELRRWSIEQKALLLADQRSFAEALVFLREMEEQLEAAPEREHVRFLMGFIHYRAGRRGEAERVLRAVRARLERWDELAARTSWLLGRLSLEDDRPREAIAFFEDVTDSFASGVYYDGCRLGRAEASAALEEFDTAAELYRGLIGVTAFPGAPAGEGEAHLRTSLTLLHEELRRRGNLSEALRFVALANEVAEGAAVPIRTLLLERLAAAHVALADSLLREAEAGSSADDEDADEQAAKLRRQVVQHRTQAGETHLKLARIWFRDEARSTQALWAAADEFNKAGDAKRVIDVLEEFVKSRSGSDLLPLALHRLGQAYQADAQYERAIAVYKRVLDEFPRTAGALSSVVPLAECYLTRGEEHFEDAEQTLLSLVALSGTKEELLTPEAGEYRQALFLLGKMYARFGHYEKAIKPLEEAITRYPHDPQGAAAQFLLGECYRHSATALKTEASESENVPLRKQMMEEFRQRMSRAHDLFRAVWRGEENGAGAGDGTAAELVRLGQLYQADCLFDLERYEDALPIYEEATWKYQSTPACLTAYVQIINCYQRLGRRDEAQTALRRAAYLANGMPEDAFVCHGIGWTKQQWQKYFDWLERSALF